MSMYMTFFQKFCHFMLAIWLQLAVKIINMTYEIKIHTEIQSRCLMLGNSSSKDDKHLWITFLQKSCYFSSC